MASEFLNCAWRLIISMLLFSSPDLARGDDVIKTENSTFTHEFAVVEQGDIVTHVFVVKNTSSATIQINDERVSCGCLSVKQRPQAIPPGELGKFEIELRFEGKYGRVTQSAIFQLLHPQFRSLRLMMDGLVRGVWVEPAELDLGTINVSESPEKPFTVYACGFPNLKLNSMTNSGSSVTLRPVKTEIDDRGRQQQIQVLGTFDVKWVATDATVGVNRTKLLAMLSDGKEIPVSVTAFVSGASQLQPRRILFGAIRREKKASRGGIATVPFAGKAQSIQSTSQNSYVSGTVIEVKSGKDHNAAIQFRLDFEPAADAPAGLTEGHVDFKVGEDVIFTVPYMAAIIK